MLGTVTAERSVLVCGDCGGMMVDYGEAVVCEFVDTFGGEAVGVVECGYVGEAVDCLHGIPADVCASCLGREPAWIRSQVTGKVRYSPDLVSWFVPSALGHEGSAGRGWANFVGVVQGSGALSERAAGPDFEVVCEGLGDLSGVRRFVLDPVGRPEWLSATGSDPIGERSRSDVAARAGLDWYALSDLAAADMLLSLLPAGVVEPAPIISGVSSSEASSLYSGAAFAMAFDEEDGRERLRQWRRATGRANGASAGAGRGWVS